MHRHGLAVTTRHVVVFGLRSPSLQTTTFYACLRPAGQALELGVDGMSSVYGPDATTGGFVTAGTYVAAQFSAGEADFAICARYGNPLRCPPAQYWLALVDTETGRHTDVPIYSSPPVRAFVPFPVTLALSPNAAVAWLQNSTVGIKVTRRLQLWATVLRPVPRSRVEATPVMIDAGLIDPDSLRFTGSTLHWVRDGQAHRRALH